LSINLLSSEYGPLSLSGIDAVGQRIDLWRHIDCLVLILAANMVRIIGDELKELPVLWNSSFKSRPEG